MGRHRRRARALIDVPPARFEQMVEEAVAALPPQLARVMRNVALVVDHYGADEDLLGRYDGVPLTERRSDYGGVLPDRITLFRRALCAQCSTESELIDEVRTTVVHEVAHHFGIEDDRLHELGWD
jgi:predicted Zn-dependent protease with MMP-like domain